MTTTNPKVDAFISNATKWQDEFKEMRAIALDSGLTEDVKWGQPCYTLNKANVVIIQGFKEYCGLMFFKGTLLKDPKSILQAPGAAQGARQIRFKNVGEVRGLESTIKAYIREAIEVEKSGMKVEMKTTADFEIPDEFQSRLDDNPALKSAFESLTPGRQRGYIYYFSAPKQSKTRAARVEKSIARILAGIGLND